MAQNPTFHQKTLSISEERFSVGKRRPLAQNPTSHEKKRLNLRPNVFNFKKSREEAAFGPEPYVPRKKRSSSLKNVFLSGRGGLWLRTLRPTKKRSPSLKNVFLSGRGDSNARPLRPERSALPTALLPDAFFRMRMQSY